eukprot:gene31306-6452_t
MAHETEGLELPLDVISRGVARVLENQVSAAYFCVDVEGKVVGQLMITKEWSDCYSKYNYTAWLHRLNLESVYVQPEFRGKGLFKLLYNSVREEAEKQGACGLRLYADDDNKAAHQMYEKLGMTSHYRVFEDMFTEY